MFVGAVAVVMKYYSANEYELNKRQFERMRGLAQHTMARSTALLRDSSTSTDQAVAGLAEAVGILSTIRDLAPSQRVFDKIMQCDGNKAIGALTARLQRLVSLDPLQTRTTTATPTPTQPSNKKRRRHGTPRRSFT